MNNELYEKLTRLQWLLHKQQMQGYRQGGHLADATRGQGRILAALKMQDKLSTKELSYLLGLAVSTLNEFLSKLEKGGYITREPSDQDKRIMLVLLTDKGRAEQSQTKEADLGDLFECLSSEEQASFETYLDKLIAGLLVKLGVDEEELEWLKTAQDKRGRIFSEMLKGKGRDFDPEKLREEFGRRFGSFGHGRGGLVESGYERGQFGHTANDRAARRIKGEGRNR
ncbi:MarR family transcriptional regulator [Clostridia bacterium]|nr:MarR family transcriptional regulator [Clostridia bacterium]